MNGSSNRTARKIVLCGCLLYYLAIAIIPRSDYIGVYQLSIMGDIVPMIVLAPIGLVMSINLLIDSHWIQKIGLCCLIVIFFIGPILFLNDMYNNKNPRIFEIKWFRVNRF